MKWNVIVWILVFLALMGCSQSKHEGLSQDVRDAFNQKVLNLISKLEDRQQRASLSKQLKELELAVGSTLNIVLDPSGFAQVFVESLKVAEIVPVAKNQIVVKTTNEEIQWDQTTINRKNVDRLKSRFSLLDKDNLKRNVAGFGAFLDQLYPESASNEEPAISTLLTAAIVSLR